VAKTTKLCFEAFTKKKKKKKKKTAKSKKKKKKGIGQKDNLTIHHEFAQFDEK
jgi:hypothetical protein